MKLEFRLLVVDDAPDSIEGAIKILEEYLQEKGFSLSRFDAEDLSAKGLKTLARNSGKDYDLVIVDYNLGEQDSDGAVAAAELRRQLQYTDIVFYSSDPQLDLLDKLAKHGVAGVFVATRQDLSDALKGLTDTVIGKAVDLNHMRGIAMAEVAEMDLLMEETLECVFGSSDEKFVAKAKETLEKLHESAKARLETLEPFVANGQILEVVTNSLLFSSSDKYKAVRRVAKCLANKPSGALAVLKTYEKDIILQRNTLAHAKEDISEDGISTLRSIKRGQSPVAIDEGWMAGFRAQLRAHRDALTTLCEALTEHLEIEEAASDGKEG